MRERNFNEKIELVILSCLAYVLLDIPVRITEFFPINAGLKSFLPSTLGLFLGPYGIIGCCIGCVFPSLLMGVSRSSAAYECWCILVNGIIVWYGWHIFSHSHRIHFKTLKKYVIFAGLLAVSSALCLDLKYSLSYFAAGMIIGLPINILMAGPLAVQQVVPGFYMVNDDAVFSLFSDAESLESANEVLEMTAEEKGVNMKRIFEIESCIEELSIRIFEVLPETELKVRIYYDDAISMRLNYEGKKYNPFIIGKDDDIINIMSLKIIKHRALRASFEYSGGVNHIHVVV